MLELAQNHSEELEKKMRETWLNEKYWYYHCASYFSPIGIKEDTWDTMQFASVNSSGEVIGYLAYDIDRECRFVSGLAICNFTDDNWFGMDVLRMIRDIFQKYRYRKITFCVVVGNPIERYYDRLIKRYGGRIVGTYKEHYMLPDGRLCDQKLYEIFREDYLKNRRNRNSAE